MWLLNPRQQMALNLKTKPQFSTSFTSLFLPLDLLSLSPMSSLLKSQQWAEIPNQNPNTSHWPIPSSPTHTLTTPNRNLKTLPPHPPLFFFPILYLLYLRLHQSIRFEDQINEAIRKQVKARVEFKEVFLSTEENSEICRRWVYVQI